MALLSIQATSPERRFTQKEIIAGEERPKYLLIKQHQDSVTSGGGGTNATSSGGTFMNIPFPLTIYLFIYKCHLYPHRNEYIKYTQFFFLLSHDWIYYIVHEVNNMQIKQIFFFLPGLGRWEKCSLFFCVRIVK